MMRTNFSGVSVPFCNSSPPIPVIRVGENEYENITATISDISAIQKRVLVEGVIGYQVLSPQRTILDIKNNQLIMEKTH